MRRKVCKGVQECAQVFFSKFQVPSIFSESISSSSSLILLDRVTLVHSVSMSENFIVPTNWYSELRFKITEYRNWDGFLEWKFSNIYADSHRQELWWLVCSNEGNLSISRCDKSGARRFLNPTDAEKVACRILMKRDANDL